MLSVSKSGPNQSNTIPMRASLESPKTKSFRNERRTKSPPMTIRKTPINRRPTIRFVVTSFSCLTRTRTSAPPTAPSSGAPARAGPRSRTSPPTGDPSPSAGQSRGAGAFPGGSRSPACAPAPPSCAPRSGRVERWRAVRPPRGHTRFHRPLVEPDWQISRIRLTDGLLPAAPFAHVGLLPSYGVGRGFTLYSVSPVFASSRKFPTPGFCFVRR